MPNHVNATLPLTPNHEGRLGMKAGGGMGELQGSAPGCGGMDNVWGVYGVRTLGSACSGLPAAGTGGSNSKAYGRERGSERERENSQARLSCLF